MTVSTNRKLPTATVLNTVVEERVFQDTKWGIIEVNPHDKGTWTLLAQAELNEAVQALLKGGEGRNSWASEMLQVAALCVAAVEQHGFDTPSEGRHL